MGLLEGADLARQAVLALLGAEQLDLHAGPAAWWRS